jgi:hypothetical protein
MLSIRRDTQHHSWSIRFSADGDGSDLGVPSRRRNAETVLSNGYRLEGHSLALAAVARRGSLVLAAECASMCATWSLLASGRPRLRAGGNAAHIRLASVARQSPRSCPMGGHRDVCCLLPNGASKCMGGKYGGSRPRAIPDTPPTLAGPRDLNEPPENDE